MKYTKLFSTLALATILALLVVAVPATPALAQTLTLSPTTGRVGTGVTASGVGFTPGHNIEIAFHGTFRANITASAAGAFSVSFLVPSVAPGTYQVQAIDLDTLVQVATASFVVVAPEITIKPEKGTVGTKVEISGKDFGSSETIYVDYDDSEIKIQSGDKETDRNGRFSGTTIIIPKSAAGKHTITGIGAVSRAKVKATFTVEPDIAVSPVSGPVGTSVAVSGNGFSGTRDFTIYLGNTQVTIGATDKSGSLETSFKVPAMTASTYVVKVEDKDKNSATAQFTVIATKISLSRTSGTVGSQLTVTGSGFSGTVTIKYDDKEIATTTADAKGAISATFNVPLSTHGAHTITAGDGTNQDSATFNFIATITLSPPAGNIGTLLTITGNGFGGTVTVKYDDKVVATAIADASGAFLATFAAPASTGGNHVITVSDNVNKFQTTFVMESVAPPVPAPILPVAGSKAKAETYFDWTDVTDPSGVTYIFQLAAKADFTTILLRKEGLTRSDYTVTTAEKLLSTKRDAPYYWRVKAIDGASNESAWSTPTPFYVGRFFPSLPDWAKYALIGVGVVLVGLFGFWLGRRTAYMSF